MSEVLPDLRVQRIIPPEGRCGVTYTFQTDTLEKFLGQSGVSSASELPEEFLRELCRRVSYNEQRREIERVEAMYPGSTALVIGHDTQGIPVELRSSEVGFDTLMRFASEEDSETDMRCDPTYSSVDFEIRVFDTGPNANKDPARNMGSCVLRTTLHPPSLA